MTLLLAIDPGPEKSGWCIYDGERPIHFDIWDNAALRDLGYWKNGAFNLMPEWMAVEWFQPRGMPTSQEEMDTMVEVGRFIEAWELPYTKIARTTDVKMTLCRSMKAKDPHIRQALIDRFGGERQAIGGVKCRHCKGKGWKGRGRPPCEECNAGGWEVPPGPLHGVSSHVWAALAVAVTYFEIYETAA